MFHRELAAKARWLPRGLGRRWLLPVLRWTFGRMGAAQSGAWQEVDLDGCSVFVRRPDHGSGSPRPALLWIHGGGLIMGHALQDAPTLDSMREHLGLIVASAQHRLAPEHPFPVPLDDCVEAFRWLASQPDVDVERIAVGGSSAGAGLAAALCQRLRDQGGPQPAFQLLVYPMLDDRSSGVEHARQRAFRVWDARSNALGWSSYLRGHDRDAPPAHAVPARTPDLAGLPSAWIGVGTLDLFHDEDLAYAERLRAAGVSVQTEVVEGAYHGFDAMDPDTEVTRTFLRAQRNALAGALID